MKKPKSKHRYERGRRACSETPPIRGEIGSLTSDDTVKQDEQDAALEKILDHKLSQDVKEVPPV